MTENNNHIDVNEKIQDLIDLIEGSPDNFKNLRVFLHRDRQNDCQHDIEFLMVSPTSFGKVELHNVSVEDNYVILEILDCTTKQDGIVRIDIQDASPKTFFIRWQDIMNIVYSEKYTSIDTSELLDFDF